MKIIRTQLIILNGNKRIRLDFNNSDFGLFLLLIKLPECRYSPVVNSWHIKAINNYIPLLNHSSPDHLLFYDTTPSLLMTYHEKIPLERCITIFNDSLKNRLIFRSLHDHSLIKSLITTCDHGFISQSGAYIINKSRSELKSVINYLIRMNYRINFEEESNNGKENIIIPPIRNQFTNRFRKKMKLHQYSKRTIDQYIANISKFLNYCGTNGNIEAARIISFIDEISMTGRYSRSSQNQVINSIKVYFRLMHHRQIGKLELPRPRREQKIPEILTTYEIEHLITSISNLKHRTMIISIYETGIKPCELLELKPGDIDYAGKKIFIRGGMVKNERKIPLTSRTETALRSYISDYLPENYLFEGLNGSRYSVRSLQKIFQSALVKAQIDKKASIYTLRHSFAVCQFKSGTDPGTVQHILGHSSRKTTEIYSHLMNQSENVFA